MPGNAFAVDASGRPDPFQSALIDIDEVLGEYAGNPPADAGMDAGENAFASMAASPVNASFRSPENQMSRYAPDQDTAPVMGMRRITPGEAGLYTMANSATAGTLPYIVAGARRMAGGGDKDFETLRREEQLRVQGARESLGDEAAMAYESLAPMAGAGLLARGSKTVGQAARRGGAYGAAYGGIRGYAGETEPDSMDIGARLRPALMGAAMGGVTGAAGGAAMRKGIDAVSSRMARPRPPGPANNPPSAPRQAETPAISADAERGRLALRVPRGERPKMHPEERLNQIRYYFEEGLDLEGIARQLRDSPANVARLIQRSADAPPSGGHGRAFAGLQDDARRILADVEAYRGASAPKQSPKPPNAPDRSREPLKLKEDAPRPAAKPRQADKTAEAEEAAKREARNPRRRRGPLGERSQAWSAEQVAKLTPEERDIARRAFIDMAGETGTPVKRTADGDLADIDILRGWRKWQGRNDVKPRDLRGRAGSFKARSE